MSVLAIDIALRRSGWAALGSPDVYQTGAWVTYGGQVKRWQQIGEHCRQLCRRYKPDLVVIEDAGNWGKASSQTNDRSIRALASARAVAAVACQDFASVVLISVDEWHEGYVGSKRCGKAAVQAVLRAEGYAVPTRETGHLEDGDQADALALGLYILRRQAALGLLRESR